MHSDRWRVDCVVAVQQKRICDRIEQRVVLAIGGVVTFGGRVHRHVQRQAGCCVYGQMVVVYKLEIDVNEIARILRLIGDRSAGRVVSVRRRQNGQFSVGDRLGLLEKLKKKDRLTKTTTVWLLGGALMIVDGFILRTLDLEVQSSQEQRSIRKDQLKTLD